MKNVNVCRRPDDGGAAVCQPRAAAVPAGGLRDHADRSSAPTGGATAWRNRAATCRKGPVTVMVHMASVWVPFTSESKEAIAGYPEIQKELRLGLQAVGRKLGMYLRRRQKVKQEGDAAQIFLRYLGEVADGRERDQRRRPRRALRAAAQRRQEARPPKPT